MVQRVFLKNIHKADGELKFRAGDAKDYPRDTWEGVARSAGKTVDEISAPTNEAARVRLSSSTAQSVRESLPGKERRKLRS